jgi:hypothetical protein
MLLLAVLPLVGLAQTIDSPWHRATLKGVTTVAVDVLPVDAAVERDGLTQSQIRTDVELRLRQAGIRINPASQSASGTLSVVVTAFKQETSPLYAISLSVSFGQLVTLIRDPSLVTAAPTWGIISVQVVGAARLRGVRYDVGDLVDRFINAYLEQNPKR